MPFQYDGENEGYGETGVCQKLDSLASAVRRQHRQHVLLSQLGALAYSGLDSYPKQRRQLYGQSGA